MKTPCDTMDGSQDFICAVLSLYLDFYLWTRFMCTSRVNFALFFAAVSIASGKASASSAGDLGIFPSLSDTSDFNPIRTNIPRISQLRKLQQWQCSSSMWQDERSRVFLQRLWVLLILYQTGTSTANSVCCYELSGKWFRMCLNWCPGSYSVMRLSL